MDWLDSERPTALMRVDQHLRGCTACREAGASLMWIRAIVRQLPEEEPPAAVSVRLMREAARYALGAAGAPAWDRAWTWLRGWFAGVAQIMGAHPAVAAVATLVLVAGAAGTMHLRGRDMAGTMHLRGRDMAAVHAPSQALPEASPPPGMESGEVAAPVAAAPAEDEEKEEARKEARAQQAPRREKKRDARRSRPRSSGRGVVSGGSRADDSAGDSLAGLLGSAAGAAPGPAAPASTAKDESLARVPRDRQELADRDTEHQQDVALRLHRALRQALQEGQCGQALRLARTLRRRDPAYHRGQVAPDAALQACQRAVAAKTANRAAKAAKKPAEGEIQDEAAGESAAADDE